VLLQIVKVVIQREKKQSCIYTRNLSSFWISSKKAELNKKWFRFVNRKDWTVPKHSGISAKHFEEKV